MSDDINLKGVVLKPDTGVQDFIKQFGYLLVAVGVAWGGLPILLIENDTLFAATTGILGSLFFIASGVAFLTLSKIIELLREIRDANHTIVD